MRLVDADDLKKIALQAGRRVRIDKHTGFWPCLLVADLAKAPTVDPVHAAGGCYCRECAYKSEYGYCHRPEAKGLMPKVQDNGFCSYGERRERENEPLHSTNPPNTSERVCEATP